MKKPMNVPANLKTWQRVVNGMKKGKHPSLKLRFQAGDY